ncbi:MAG: carboxypeptidase regulatory-like domain-containing protein [Mediterranea sp.]|jgi:hypothetical protein|nr:carboxypeptidase regulatory-like domain-containing protein [Mediterranea sp.]
MKKALLKDLAANTTKLHYSPMQRGFCLLLILFLAGLSLHAQITMKGVVSNTAGSPVANINILLYTSSDSLLVKTASTDGKGRFVLSAVPKGSYRLSASGIGYENTRILIDNAVRDIASLQIVLNEKAEELEEVTVLANRVINKFDRKIHFPNDFEKNNSAGGIELIDKMGLSGVIVSKIDNSITGIKGGSIQLRINGAPATAIDVQTIDPKLVTQIEYHDMPSMRYGEAEGVIDIYVKKKESGGSLKLFSINAFQIDVASGTANLKINHRKSEFAFWGWYSIANLNKEYSIKEEVLNFEDGQTLRRTREGIPARSRETVYSPGASYSYLDPGRILFLAKMSYNYFSQPVRIGKSRIYSSAQPDAYTIQQDSSIYRDRKPAFNLYFQKKGKNKQFFAFDIVANYFDTNTFNRYLESREDNSTITDVFSDVGGSKYSVIAEAIYEKGLGKGKIGMGVKQSMSFMDNSYKGSEDYENTMKQYVTDAYAEWSASKDKFSYGISGGGKLQQNIQAANSSTLKYKLSLRLGYAFSRNIDLRYQGRVSVQTPSPGSLNTVRLEEDGYRIRSGNPGLKPETGYNNMLDFSFDHNSFRSSLNVDYIFTTNPMLRNIFREDGKFISQEQNGKAEHSVDVTGYFRYSPFNRRLSMYARGGYRFIKNKTEDYSHSLNNAYVNAGISGTHKHFTLSGEVRTRMKLLLSELIMYREQTASVGIDYQWKELKVGGIMHWQLGPYSRRNVELNRYLSSNTYQYSPDSQASFRLKLSWNFNFGLQRESGYKRIENSDEDNGLLK